MFVCSSLDNIGIQRISELLKFYNKSIWVPHFEYPKIHLTRNIIHFMLWLSNLLNILQNWVVISLDKKRKGLVNPLYVYQETTFYSLEQCKVLLGWIFTSCSAFFCCLSQLLFSLRCKAQVRSMLGFFSFSWVNSLHPAWVIMLLVWVSFAGAMFGAVSYWAKHNFSFVCVICSLSLSPSFLVLLCSFSIEATKNWAVMVRWDCFCLSLCLAVLAWLISLLFLSFLAGYWLAVLRGFCADLDGSGSNS